MYPKQMYHAFQKPVEVTSPEEEQALGSDWSSVYIHQEFPKVVKTAAGDVVVHSPDELDAALAVAPVAVEPAPFYPELVATPESVVEPVEEPIPAPAVVVE